MREEFKATIRLRKRCIQIAPPRFDLRATFLENLSRYLVSCHFMPLDLARNPCFVP